MTLKKEAIMAALLKRKREMSLTMGKIRTNESLQRSQEELLMVSTAAWLVSSKTFKEGTF